MSTIRPIGIDTTTGKRVFYSSGDTMQGTGASSIDTSYRVIMQAAGSHIAGKSAGTYILGLGDPVAPSGLTGSLYPIQLFNLVASDYAVSGATTKLRVRATVSVNGTSPTGNFTVGLYPVVSSLGGAGLKIYTLSAPVSNSTATSVVAPINGSMTNVASLDFALPVDGVYALGLVTTSTVATSSLVHINASLHIRNT